MSHIQSIQCPLPETGVAVLYEGEVLTVALWHLCSYARIHLESYTDTEHHKDESEAANRR